MNVVMIDRYVTDIWYTNNLVRALSKLCNIRYYADIHAKKSKIVKPLWYGIFFPFQIVREVIKDNPDIVHIQFELNMFGRTVTNLGFFFMLFLLKLLGKRTVVTIHGVIPYELFDSGRIKEVIPSDVVGNVKVLKLGIFLVYGGISKLSDKIIVHSSIFKRWLYKDYLLNLDKIFVIPHGISEGIKTKFTEKRETSGDRMILNFGVITPRKGLETLIEAFSKVSVPHTKLVIAGREVSYYVGYLDKIKNLTKEWKIENRISFTGFLLDDMVHYLFEKSEIVVIPYSMGISASGVLSLAIQHRKPTIVTDTEFFKEELSDDEVIFTSIDDAEELAKNMELLLNSPRLKERLAKNIGMRIEPRSWKNVAKKHMEVYG